MTAKRAPSDTPLGEIKDYDALDSVWSALEADPRLLAKRLRDGTASPAERRLAADLLEGKKPKRPRRQSSRHEQRRIAEYVAFIRYVHPRAPQKYAICRAIDHFKISERHVHNVLKKFNGDALAQFERMYRNSTAEDWTPRTDPESERLRALLRENANYDFLVELAVELLHETRQFRAGVSK
jgi:hypothetical protein